MKSLILLFFLLVVLLGMFACKPHSQVITVDPVDGSHTIPMGNGIFYTLLRAAFTIDIIGDRIHLVPGPFAEYACNFLGIDNVIRGNSTTCRIASIQINSFSEPDAQQVLFTSVSPDVIAKTNFTISLTETGKIQIIKTPYFQGEIHAEGDAATSHKTPCNVFTFNYFTDFNLQERVYTLLDLRQIDSFVVSRETPLRALVEKPKETRAREIAVHILDSCNKRFALITGYAAITYSPEALEYMYTELGGKQEDEYLELFTGIASVNQIHYRITFVPNPATGGQLHTIFFLSEREGAVPTNRPDAVPVVLTTDRNNMTRISEQIGPQPITSNLVGVIYFRIPVHAVVNVLSGNTPSASSKILINQFGFVEAIPFHSRGVKFYPHTGAILSMVSVELQRKIAINLNI